MQESLKGPGRDGPLRVEVDTLSIQRKQPTYLRLCYWCYYCLKLVGEANCWASRDSRSPTKIRVIEP